MAAPRRPPCPAPSRAAHVERDAARELRSRATAARTTPARTARGPPSRGRSVTRPPVDRPRPSLRRGFAGSPCGRDRGRPHGRSTSWRAEHERRAREGRGDLEARPTSPDARRGAPRSPAARGRAGERRQRDDTGAQLTRAARAGRRARARRPARAPERRGEGAERRRLHRATTSRGPRRGRSGARSASIRLAVARDRLASTRDRPRAVARRKRALSQGTMRMRPCQTHVDERARGSPASGSAPRRPRREAEASRPACRASPRPGAARARAADSSSARGMATLSRGACQSRGRAGPPAFQRRARRAARSAP